MSTEQRERAQLRRRNTNKVPSPSSPSAMLDGSGIGLISKPLVSKPAVVPNSGAGGVEPGVTVPICDMPRPISSGFPPEASSALFQFGPPAADHARIWKLIGVPAAYGAGN